MSKLPESQSPRFISLTDRRQELLVVSPVEGWISHWDNAQKRSRNCGGASCSLCHFGSPRVVRFDMMVITSSGHEALLELRERHRDLCEEINSRIALGVGVRIVARKEGRASNSPVDVRILGNEDAYIREIRKLVDVIGLPPLREEISKAIAAELDQPRAVNLPT